MRVLVRHKVADFAKWKPVYDDHLQANQKVGLKEVHLLGNIENLHRLTQVIGSANALALSRSSAEKQRAGVSDKQDNLFP